MTAEADCPYFTVDMEHAEHVCRRLGNFPLDRDEKGGLSWNRSPACVFGQGRIRITLTGMDQG